MKRMDVALLYVPQSVSLDEWVLHKVVSYLGLDSSHTLPFFYRICMSLRMVS